MTIKTKTQFTMLDKAIAKCTGSVVLSDFRSGEEYDLKNPMERVAAYSRLKEDFREELELFVVKREDTQVMLELMDSLYKNNGGGSGQEYDYLERKEA